MIDVKSALRRMFEELAQDSWAAGKLGAGSEGYAVLGGERDGSGKLTHACIHVDNLIREIELTLQRAQEELRALVAKSCMPPLPAGEYALVHDAGDSPYPTMIAEHGRALTIAELTRGKVGQLDGVVEIALDPVDFAIRLEDAYDPAKPVPVVRLEGHPEVLHVFSPYGERSYRDRCTSVVMNDLTKVCLLPAGHNEDCQRILILAPDGPVCGELLGDMAYCRLYGKHRPEQHFGHARSGGTYRW